jgi:hypothetical protein
MKTIIEFCPVIKQHQKYETSYGQNIRKSGSYGIIDFIVRRIGFEPIVTE